MLATNTLSNTRWLPLQALAQLICSDYRSAGRQVFQLIQAGEPLRSQETSFKKTKLAARLPLQASLAHKPCGGLQACPRTVRRTLPLAWFSATPANTFDPSCPVWSGGDQATQAAAALKQARCSDKNLVPKAVTVASIREQGPGPAC